MNETEKLLGKQGHLLDKVKKQELLLLGSGTE